MSDGNKKKRKKKRKTVYHNFFQSFSFNDCKSDFLFRIVTSSPRGLSFFSFLFSKKHKTFFNFLLPFSQRPSSPSLQGNTVCPSPSFFPFVVLWIHFLLFCVLLQCLWVLFLFSNHFAKPRTSFSIPWFEVGNVLRFSFPCHPSNHYLNSLNDILIFHEQIYFWWEFGRPRKQKIHFYVLREKPSASLWSLPCALRCTSCVSVSPSLSILLFLFVIRDSFCVFHFHNFCRAFGHRVNNEGLSSSRSHFFLLCTFCTLFFISSIIVILLLQ